jgi:hypothetical protein
MKRTSISGSSSMVYVGLSKDKGPPIELFIFVGTKSIVSAMIDNDMLGVFNATIQKSSSGPKASKPTNRGKARNPNFLGIGLVEVEIESVRDMTSDLLQKEASAGRIEKFTATAVGKRVANFMVNDSGKEDGPSSKSTV